MKLYFAALASGIVLAACAPATPDQRIAAHPEKFAGLPAKQQTLVRRGMIDRGMSRDGVYLAWGGPARKFTGNYHGKPAERWDYTATEPVYSHSLYAGFGFSPTAYGLGFGPDVTYVPYRSASVLFLNDRVNSWEHLRGGARQ